MYLLATGKFIDRSKIEALRKDEIEKARALEREGVLLSAYRRSDGEGKWSYCRWTASSMPAPAPANCLSSKMACWRSNSLRSRL
jgi:hypothetical protein